MRHLEKLKHQMSRIKGKKEKREKSEIEFDKNFNSMSQDVGGYIEDEEMFSEIQQKQKRVKKRSLKKLKVLKEEYDDDDKNAEYRRLLNDKDYQDYLNYQRNRANYVNNIQSVEGFSNINDNF